MHGPLAHPKLQPRPFPSPRSRHPKYQGDDLLGISPSSKHRSELFLAFYLVPVTSSLNWENSEAYPLLEKIKSHLTFSSQTPWSPSSSNSPTHRSLILVPLPSSEPIVALMAARTWLIPKNIHLICLRIQVKVSQLKFTSIAKEEVQLFCLEYCNPVYV